MALTLLLRNPNNRSPLGAVVRRSFRSDAALAFTTALKLAQRSSFEPIGAVVYMQRNNLKMCLRSIDSATDYSEVAKAYGGGGSPSSSSFIMRMDEYNQWLAVNSS